MTAPKLLSAEAISPVTIDLVFDQPMTGIALKTISNYSVVPALPAFNIATAIVVNAVTVRLQLKASMLDGGSYTVTVNDKLKSSLNESVDPAFRSAEFIGIGTKPVVTSAIATDAQTIRVTFKEAIDPASASVLSIYTITSESTGRTIPLSASTPIGTGSGLVTKVDLTISSSSKMTDGGLHTLDVLGVKSAAGTEQTAISSAEFIGIADLPRVIAVSFDELSNSAIIEFDSPVQRTGASALGSFAVVSQPGVPQLYHSSIDVAEDRRSLALELSDAKTGALYLVAVSPNVVDDFANPIDGDHNSGTFIAVGTLPTLVRAVPIGTNRLDLVFSKPIRDSAAVRDEIHYSATGGLTIVKVLDVELETIKLATSDQLPGAAYTITIS